MNHSSHRVANQTKRYEEELPSPDTETYIKDYRPRVTNNMLKSFHAISQQPEREPHFSQPKINKSPNFTGGNNTMSRLKNELQNLKLDFSEFFGDEANKIHGESFLKSKRSITTKSPKI